MRFQVRCQCAYKILEDGNEFCPVHDRQVLFRQKSEKLKQDFFGESPCVFVGRFGYPYVNVGIMSPPETEDTWIYDAPKYWAQNDYKIPQIVNYRSSLVNSRFNINIKSASKLLDIGQEIGMASKPVDVEINLKDKPKFRVNTTSYMAPTGPNAKLKNVRVTENPKISHKVEKVVDDIHLKASDAMAYLYEHNFDENFLTRLISVGNIGYSVNRKLVPTRDSITAVDDTLGKHLLKDVRDYALMDYAAFFGSYLGNYYLILCFPEVWSYELFETYVPSHIFDSKKLSCTTDYEPYEGRKSYAENTAGGFYACRIGVLEKLKEMKRQGSVLALRFITDEYTMPLGVFVCRESTRKSMNSKPIVFGSKELMLAYARKLVKKKFNFDLDVLLGKSMLLRNVNEQKKLRSYF